VLEVLAAAKGMEEAELAEICYRNTRRVFFPDDVVE
jgi:Tat protein secretion system quality control protein TatD with DNase activity